MCPLEVLRARRIPAYRVSVTANVYASGPIRKINSPSHPEAIVITSSAAQANAARKLKYSSKDFLSCDFVLSVVADGLDAPRCFAQRNDKGFVAMQLTMVPKFNLPPIATQEYIFLVDRSGSMEGDRIRVARRCLTMLLRSLPARGTFFNIFGFGTNCRSLWRQSMAYDERSLTEAVSILTLLRDSLLIYRHHIDRVRGQYRRKLWWHRNRGSLATSVQVSKQFASHCLLRPNRRRGAFPHFVRWEPC